MRSILMIRPRFNLRPLVLRGLMDPVDPLLLLFNIWALTQFYSEHAEQVEFFSDRSVADPAAREEIIAQTIQFVLRGVGVR